MGEPYLSFSCAITDDAPDWGWALEMSGGLQSIHFFQCIIWNERTHTEEKICQYKDCRKTLGCPRSYKIIPKNESTNIRNMGKPFLNM